MYNNGSITAGGALAATGIAFNTAWIFLAMFAVFAGILAVARILPRLH